MTEVKDFNFPELIESLYKEQEKIIKEIKKGIELKSVSNFLDSIKHFDKAYIQYLFNNLDLFNELDKDVFNELKDGVFNLLISKEMDLDMKNNGNGSGPKP